MHSDKWRSRKIPPKYLKRKFHQIRKLFLANILRREVTNMEQSLNMACMHQTILSWPLIRVMVGNHFNLGLIVQIWYLKARRLLRPSAIVVRAPILVFQHWHHYRSCRWNSSQDLRVTKYRIWWNNTLSTQRKGPRSAVLAWTYSKSSNIRSVVLEVNNRSSLEGKLQVEISHLEPLWTLKKDYWLIEHMKPK